MEIKELHKHVKESYEDINNKWLKFHFKLFVSCIITGGIMEIVTFFIILFNNTLNCTIAVYWLKYLIAPVSLMMFIMMIAYFVLQNKKASINSKQYIISFLFALLGLVLSLAHSGFAAVMSCAIFPVLMTVMYENQRLTTQVSILCMISQFVSGFAGFWDPDKVVNSDYFINMIILVVATFLAWRTCFSMIEFMKMKRKIIISNDIERYRLKERVNIDSLTGIGNKFTLMQRLDEVSTDENKISCLVMMAIDDFKHINDAYGHLFGDDVIRCIGDGMRGFRVNADAFRYGGDEFCILFEEQSLDIVILELKKLQQYLKYNIRIKNSDKKIFISAGITTYDKEKTLTELLKQADEALYESKKQYGGQITIFKEKKI